MTGVLHESPLAFNLIIPKLLDLYAINKIRTFYRLERIGNVNWMPTVSGIFMTTTKTLPILYLNQNMTMEKCHLGPRHTNNFDTNIAVKRYYQLVRYQTKSDSIKRQALYLIELHSVI